MSFLIKEIERRIAGLINVGTVIEVDAVQAKAKVSIGNLGSHWLPWTVRRASSSAVTWWSPSVGEQVVVLASCGELSAAIITDSLYRTDYPAPSSDTDLAEVVFADGTEVSYDASSKILKVSAAGGTLKLEGSSIEIVGSSIEIQGPVVQTGGDITSDGISVQSHTHIDTAGTSAGITSGPNP